MYSKPRASPDGFGVFVVLEKRKPRLNHEEREEKEEHEGKIGKSFCLLRVLRGSVSSFA
jgi:hypothetical protein